MLTPVRAMAPPVNQRRSLPEDASLFEEIKGRFATPAREVVAQYRATCLMKRPGCFHPSTSKSRKIPASSKHLEQFVVTVSRLGTKAKSRRALKSGRTCFVVAPGVVTFEALAT